MVCGLISEVLPDHSCLVFCPTRKNCENLGTLLCKFLKPELTQHRRSEKLALFKAIIEEGNGTICPALKKTIPYGVAYHHSGRLCLIFGFLNNYLKYISPKVSQS